MCIKLCKSKKIILDGKEITLRNPRMGDVKTLLEFINSLVKEGVPILVNKKTTLKEERIWLKDHMNKIRQGTLHTMLAVHKNEVIGNTGISLGKWRNSHVATLGISVKKNYRRIGLGTLLMEEAVKVAEKDPKIKILTLTVYETNKVATKLYEKVGFRMVAKLPGRVYYKGEYGDEYVMDYPLKK